MRLTATLISPYVFTSLRKRWAEWSLSVTLLVVGAMVLGERQSPPDPRYAQWAEVAPTWVWGTVICVLAIVRLAILYRNGRWSGSYLGRVVCSIITLSIWYNIALLAWLNLDSILVTTMGLSILPILVEGSSIVFALNERVQARESKSGYALYHE